MATKPVGFLVDTIFTYIEDELGADPENEWVKAIMICGERCAKTYARACDTLLNKMQEGQEGQEFNDILKYLSVSYDSSDSCLPYPGKSYANNSRIASTYLKQEWSYMTESRDRNKKLFDACNNLARIEFGFKHAGSTFDRSNYIADILQNNEKRKNTRNIFSYRHMQSIIFSVGKRLDVEQAKRVFTIKICQMAMRRFGLCGSNKDNMIRDDHKAFPLRIGSELEEYLGCHAVHLVANLTIRRAVMMTFALKSKERLMMERTSSTSYIMQYNRYVSKMSSLNTSIVSLAAKHDENVKLANAKVQAFTQQPAPIEFSQTKEDSINRDESDWAQDMPISQYDNYLTNTLAIFESSLTSSLKGVSECRKEFQPQPLLNYAPQSNIVRQTFQLHYTKNSDHTTKGVTLDDKEAVYKILNVILSIAPNDPTWSNMVDAYRDHPVSIELRHLIQQNRDYRVELDSACEKLDEITSQMGAYFTDDSSIDHSSYDILYLQSQAAYYSVYCEDMRQDIQSQFQLIKERKDDGFYLFPPTSLERNSDMIKHLRASFSSRLKGELQLALERLDTLQRSKGRNKKSDKHKMEMENSIWFLSTVVEDAARMFQTHLLIAYAIEVILLRNDDDLRSTFRSKEPYVSVSEQTVRCETTMEVEEHTQISTPVQVMDGANIYKTAETVAENLVQLSQSLPSSQDAERAIRVRLVALLRAFK